jgi:hypothetical protein
MTAIDNGWPCPYCQKLVNLWKHLGHCTEAFIELDENTKRQADALRQMSPEQVEAEVQRALAMFKAMYAQRTGHQPDDKWISDQTKAIRAEAIKFLGKRPI